MRVHGLHPSGKLRPLQDTKQKQNEKKDKKAKAKLGAAYASRCCAGKAVLRYSRSLFLSATARRTNQPKSERSGPRLPHRLTESRNIDSLKASDRKGARYGCSCNPPRSS